MEPTDKGTSQDHTDDKQQERRNTKGSRPRTDLRRRSRGPENDRRPPELIHLGQMALQQSGWLNPFRQRLQFPHLRRSLPRRRAGHPPPDRQTPNRRGGLAATP